MASIFDSVPRTSGPTPATSMDELIARKKVEQAGYRAPSATVEKSAAPPAAPSRQVNANEADLLGVSGGGNVGGAGNVKAPPPRGTSPDGLTYSDTGEYTPLYYARQNAGQPGYENYIDHTFLPTRDQLASGEYKKDAATGTYYTTAANGIDRLYVTNDPTATSGAPAFTVGADGTTLSPGDGTVPGRQGTQAEADRANAYYQASGNSTPPGGFGAPADAAMAHQTDAALLFGGAAAARQAQASDLRAQGAAAQGRSAPQTSRVDYGRAQDVGYSKAQAVDYGNAQTIAAPTLASAREAAMGNFGAQQSVQAQQVGPAAMASAQQAQNQAGFLSGTAAGARNVADLDYAQADQSRGDVQQSLSDIRGFLAAGPGPSMAQQQLRMAQEQNLGDALSLARSGRGNAAGNMKMALSENAATNAQTNMQAALLRANEADAWQQRQLQGLGLQSSTATNLRGQDIGAATAAGQHALSREQLAANVDVSRAGLEQQLALQNAELGTRANLQNAAETNTGNRLNAQLGTEAAIQEAALANSRNIAQGQAGTQVSMQNAAEQNQTSRLQGQLQSDAAIQQAQLANQLNIAQGDSTTNLRGINANNSSAADRTQAELANQLAIAQGNSTTNLRQSNLEAKIRQQEANDRLLAELSGQAVDLGSQEINALNYGAGNAFNYDNLAAEIDWRNLDRAAGIKSEAQARKDKKDAAAMSAFSALLAEVIPG